MIKDDESDRDHRVALHRVASALGVPVESFFDPDGLGASGEPTAEVPRRDLADALALMHLFLQLKAPAARERCLTFVQGEVDAEA